MFESSITQATVDVVAERAASLAAEKVFGPEKRDELMSRIQTVIRDSMQFRLLGYDIGGNKIPWEEDVQQIISVEKTLVVDPQKLKQEFQQIRQKRKEVGKGPAGDHIIDEFIAKNSLFAQVGGHVFLNTANTLFYVRENGWAVIAGLPGKDEAFVPLGYNYGFNEMPEDDDRFAPLCKDTLMIPDSEKGKMHPGKTAVTWRTGIKEHIDACMLRELGINIPDGINQVDLRSMGIGTALKLILTIVAQMRGVEKVIFNIGTIYDYCSNERIRNIPSFHHNKRIYEEDLGYRSGPSSGIRIDHGLGNEETVAKVRWRARGDDIESTMHKLQKAQGVLGIKRWNIKNLEHTASLIFEQKQAEKKKSK